MPKQSKQHTLWLLAAASAPLAHFSGCGWLTALASAAVILPLTLIPKSWEGMPRTLTVLQLCWLGAVAGLLIQNSAAYWPSDQKWVVPLTLLVLAAVTPGQSAPRIGAVLAFCVGLLALPVAISGAAHAEPGWLEWRTGSWPTALMAALLFPALLVQGTISLNVAAAVPAPFYQTARTLGYLEPVAAVGMTLSWYAMAVYLLHSACMIAKNGDISAKIAPVLTTGTAFAVLLLKWQPDAQKCLILSLFLWVLIPFLTKIKKSKKDEKRC